jgi:glycosyltransferase involved in cell wall biosynthesis
MNVGLVVPGFSADDADWCIPALRDLARCLASRTSLRVISVRYPYRAGRYVVEGAPVIALGGGERRAAGSLHVWQRTLAALRAEHRRQPFDILHAFWATESGLLAALAGRVLGIPTLVSLAGGELVGLPQIGYGDQLVGWERLKVRAALRLATAVSAGSNSLVERARRRVRHVRKLPLGVDRARFFRAERKTESTSLRVVHVGTLTPVKDQLTLLHAFALLRQQRSDARLAVIGDGPLRAMLDDQARRLAVADAVDFVGAVDHGQLAAHYQRADVFALSSCYEAQGMVALEALSCGVPVVGTSVGVVPEIGQPVPVGDAHALANALAWSRASACLPAEFELGPAVDRFVAVYHELAA